MIDYNQIFKDKLQELKDKGNYRTFMEIQRLAGDFPYANYINNQTNETKKVISWCSNDYLGLGQHPEVTKELKDIVDKFGGGAGGTRNISGTNTYHIRLEEALKNWYQLPAALCFASAYNANMAALGAFGRLIPGIVMLSDELNHNSMIEGIKSGRCEKTVFRHNDLAHLEEKLQSYPLDKPKMIVFESVYSMEGDVAPIKEICDLADKYNAMTYIDEVHAVALYGDTGSGYCEKLGIRDRLTVIQGTFAKGLGLVGGFIAGTEEMCDFVRSFGYSFIFTTSMPPAIAGATVKSIELASKHNEWRQGQQANAQYLKDELRKAGMEVYPSTTHIVPVMIRDAVKAKKASDLLLNKYGHYVQPINAPTVPHGTERLRFAPSQCHTPDLVDKLVSDMKEVWTELEI